MQILNQDISLKKTQNEGNTIPKKQNKIKNQMEVLTPYLQAVK
jgi:hypothetical protein